MATITVVDSTSQCGAVTRVGHFAHTATTCTNPGSGSGGAGGGSDQDCGYYEWEISYDGGLTWYPYGDPFWYCPGDPIYATGVGRIAGKGQQAIQSDSSYHVSLFGTKILGSQKVTVYRDLKHSANPIVVIDTVRATPADLEGALQALHEVTTFSPSNAQITNGRLQTQAQPRSRAATGRIVEEDVKLLRDLGRSDLVTIDGLGRGRLLEATVSRPRDGHKGAP